jgi:hypothetical protein
MEDTYSVEESPPLAPSHDVEIRIGPRAVYGIIGVLGLLIIFGAGLWLGISGGGRKAAQALAAPVQSIQQPAFQSIPQPFQHPDASEVPAVIRPAPDHAPDGDHPHLALPELADSDYVLDFGDIGPDEPVSRILTIRNFGTQELVISRTGTS